MIPGFGFSRVLPPMLRILVVSNCNFFYGNTYLEFAFRDLAKFLGTRGRKLESLIIQRSDHSLGVPGSTVRMFRDIGIEVIDE
jgi:hypothetical protein